jgi:Periplasmic protein involved in polysaccharide export
MKKLNFLPFYLFTFLSVLLLTGCGPVKNVAYLQNSDSINFDDSRFLYDARIMPKDQITISVNSTTPEASLPFNLLLQNAYQQGRTISSGAGGTLMPYLVDNEGNINFPIIGRLHVGGLTKSECERLIAEKIRPYMAETENPVVTVTMASYSVSVLGEVARPGSFQVSREKITILEALAQAGDLTIYGVRERVKLIREDASGKKSIVTLNLNDANIVNSPYYYLQQNDVIYVEPNNVKAQNSKVGQTTTLWFSATSILISLTSLLYNILK